MRTALAALTASAGTARAGRAAGRAPRSAQTAPGLLLPHIIPLTWSSISPVRLGGTEKGWRGCTVSIECLVSKGKCWMLEGHKGTRQHVRRVTPVSSQHGSVIATCLELGPLVFPLQLLAGALHQRPQ